jgi:hypothetical protein
MEEAAMRRSLSVVVLALIGALALGGQVSAGSDPAFWTSFSGAAEVPGPGDPDGGGAVLIHISPAQHELCYKLGVFNIAPATAAHVHFAPVGVAGPVVVPLDPPTSGASKGCATVTTALANAIIANPANYYVNVHNAAYPNGAIRGQLARK